MRAPADPRPHPPLGVVLAGGASRRFGAPKALARVGGRRIIDRVLDALSAAVPEVVISANEPALFADLDLPIRADEIPGQGALGGLHTALRWAMERGRSGALIVACDMPGVTAKVLSMIVDRAAATEADTVAPESEGRRGAEIMCAWYSVRCLPAVERMIGEGEVGVHRLLERVRVELIPLAEIRRIGDPHTLFQNVNTPEELRDAEERATPPAVCIIGRKNSGKTTLAVAVLAELRRRGYRVASIKHGHHAFETDQPGRDSWRHFNEGEAEATIMAGTGKIALVMRMDGDPDPARLVRDFYAGRGYDLVLIEGYKHGPFPRIEVFRRAMHDRPLLEEMEDGAEPYLALVTDDLELRVDVPLILMDPHHPDAHVQRVADVLANLCRSGPADGR